MSGARRAEQVATKAAELRRHAGGLLHALLPTSSFRLSETGPTPWALRCLNHVRLSAITVIATSATALAIASPTAAAPKSIGGYIGGASGSVGGEFTQPRDVAVFEGTDGDPATDKIFVVESTSARVDRLDRSGNFELMWGKDVDASNSTTGAETCLDPVACKGGVVGTGAGEFGQPTGIAVDQVNGWVYVYDRDNKRVQKFDLDGSFLLMFGDGVNTGLGGNPDVCTNAGPPTDVCGIGTGGVAVGQIGPAGNTALQVRGVAVSPVDGDVFVADPSNRRVQRFNSDGTLDAASSFGSATDFGSNQPLHVAVDSSGIVYASDSNPTSTSQRVQRYDTSAAAFLAPVDSPPLLSSGTTPTVGLDIDPDTDGGGSDEEHLLVARDPGTGNTVVQEFDIPATPTDPITTEIADSPHVYADASINGIGVSGGSDSIYLAVAQSAPAGPGHGLIVLTPPAGSLTAAALSPQNTTATTAQLSGTVDVNGTASYRFELAKGGNPFAAVGAKRFITGTAGIPVATGVAGLDPNTLYRVRIVVSRVVGFPNVVTSSASNEMLFVTPPAPPAATTVAASSITDTTARIAGRVNPRGSDTSYRFEYGTTTSYGNRAPASPAMLGSGQTEELVSAELSQLLPAKTYHYRICATSTAATACGTDRAFETKPEGGTPPTDGRGYELVSPADKVSGTGVGYWYQGPATAGLAGTAAIQGERFASQGYLGSVLVDGKFSFGNDWAFAERVDDTQGWVNHSPFSRGGYGPQAYRLTGFGSATHDLGLTAWSSEGVLRLFPEMESWSDALSRVPFVADWSGRWEVVAPTDLSQVVNVGGIRDIVPVQASNAPYTVFSTAHVRGLAGSGDPSVDLADFGSPGASGDPKVVYMDDLSGGVSDTFPGTGVRSVVSVCTGAEGVDRTVIPARTVSGKLASQECATAAPGRDGRLVSERGAALPDESLGNEISANGSRVFFLAPDPTVEDSGQLSCATTTSEAATRCPAQLYVRQRNTDGSVVTRWISQTAVSAASGAASDQDASLMDRVVFEHASADGDRVFFRTQAPLTADDPDGMGAAPVGGVTTGVPGAPGNDSWDLYMYDLPDGPDGDPSTPDADPAGGRLVRVSGGPDGESDCNVRNDSQGNSRTTAALRFASRDGGVAYFTCSAPLAGVGGSSNGTITEPGGSPTESTSANLYSYDDKSGDYEFIVRLPRGMTNNDINTCATTARAPGWALATFAGSPNMQINRASCFRGTDDGSFVTFTTLGRLMADDPDSAAADIYGFDRSAGELVRVTAPDEGMVDGSYPCNTVEPVVQCHGDGGIGGGAGVSVFPLAPLNIATEATSSSNRLAFFQSRSRLVPEDINDVYDVYEWRNGDLSLISTGASGSDGAFYKGNDVSGRNVYFATLDRLSWQDRDSALDVYSARVGGGIEEPVPPVVCVVLSGGCRGPGGDLAAPGVSGGSGGNAIAGRRAVVSLVGVSRRARVRAARTGRLVLGVRTSAPGRLSLSVRAKFGKRSRRVGSASRDVTVAGRVSVRIGLSSAARKWLRRGRALSVVVVVSQVGARDRSMTVRLPGVSS